MRKHTPAIVRLMRRVELDGSGCWLWTGPVTKKGYSRLSGGLGPDGVYYMQQGHRLVYEHHRGPIPEGLVIDHLCRVRRCVNPWHLEVVTPAENTRRGDTNRMGAQRHKTHCPQGHPYDEANTDRRPNGWRRCRTCHREQERLRRAS